MARPVIEDPLNQTLPSWKTFLAEGGLRPASYREIAAEDRKCAICMNKFCFNEDNHDSCAENAEQPIKVLACQRHFFGCFCPTKWLRRSNRCPVCRNDLFEKGSDDKDEDGGGGFIDGQADEWVGEWMDLWEEPRELSRLQSELDAVIEPRAEYIELRQRYRERFFWAGAHERLVTF